MRPLFIAPSFYRALFLSRPATGRLRALFVCLALSLVGSAALAQAPPAYPGTTTTVPAQLYSWGSETSDKGTWSISGPGISISSSAPGAWALSHTGTSSLTVTVPANAPVGTYTADYITGWQPPASLMATVNSIPNFSIVASSGTGGSGGGELVSGGSVGIFDQPYTPGEVAFTNGLTHGIDSFTFGTFSNLGKDGTAGAYGLFALAVASNAFGGGTASAAHGLPDFTGWALKQIEGHLGSAGFTEKQLVQGSTSTYRTFVHADGSKVSINTLEQVVKVNGPKIPRADGLGMKPDRINPHNQSYIK